MRDCVKTSVTGAVVMEMEHHEWEIAASDEVMRNMLNEDPERARQH